MVSRVPSTVAWTHTTVVASPGSVEMLGSEIGIRSEGMERNGRKKQKRSYAGIRKIGGTLVEDFGGEDCGRAVTGLGSFSPRRLLTGSSIHPSAVAVVLYHLSHRHCSMRPRRTSKKSTAFQYTNFLLSGSRHRPHQPTCFYPGSYPQAQEDCP